MTINNKMDAYNHLKEMAMIDAQERIESAKIEEVERRNKSKLTKEDRDFIKSTRNKIKELQAKRIKFFEAGKEFANSEYMRQGGIKLVGELAKASNEIFKQAGVDMKYKIGAKYGIFHFMVKGEGDYRFVTKSKSLLLSDLIAWVAYWSGYMEFDCYKMLGLI